MMTVLENSRSDLENQEFFSPSPRKHNQSLKCRLNEMKKTSSLKKDITLFSSPCKTFKNQNSIIFINASALEETIRGSSKSLSMSIDFNLEETQFELLMEEGCSHNKKDDDSLLDSGSENESPYPPKSRNQIAKKLTLSMAEKNPLSAKKNQYKKEKIDDPTSVILNKKLVYFDEEGYLFLIYTILNSIYNIDKEYYQIPPEYIKYLLLSFQEFDSTNKNYVEWNKMIFYKASKEGHLKPGSSDSAYYSCEVPKIDISLFFDKQEDDKIGF